MTHYKNIIGAIGNTPLIRLNYASKLTGCEILGKCEFLNPGQSVKDRAALYIIREAEKSGQLKPNGTIVEGTAGNTGIGLTMLANILGYKSIIVIPNTQSQEKKDTLRILGAKLIEVEAKPYKDPDNFVRYSERLAKELDKSEPNGAFWANQFDNLANSLAHYETTGREIISQTNGEIDGFICAVGTGGTLSGVARALKEHNEQIKIGLADPEGAALYNYFKNGELTAQGSSITEGIGQSRITKNLEGFRPDFAYQISDKTALPFIFEMIEREGLCLGGSSAINIAGAVQMAKEMGKGKTIVTMLCDYGNRYQTSLYNKEFLEKKNLPIPNWL